MMLRPGTLFLAMLLTVVADSAGTAEVLQKTVTGSPALKSINVLEFAPVRSAAYRRWNGIANSGRSDR